ncbi:ribosome silencing factor [uncultured Campylobacter sp.]|uniref:ribosome silencing factor n=1 Tax=uncultured Campylobacter sp. TaxID=218934 RepID=UPI00263553A9|nr:ribosome silencing factor [uncultured Campylobacter sp.]
MKIALFGGSFDPPHAGHDAAVRAILSALKPDLLVIMPSFLNPFKKSFSAPPQLRLKWCRALWSDAPHVEVSDYEISQNVPVPTIQSVKFLLEKHGGNSKIAAETAVEMGKILQGSTADQISVGSESETGGISQSKVGKIPRDGTSEAGSAGDASETRSVDKISNTDEVSNVAANRMSNVVMSEVSNSAGDKILSASRIPNAARNEISDVVKIPNAGRNEISDAGRISSAASSEILNAVTGKFSSASEIPSGNANCMADAGGANCVGSANSAGDAGDANDMDDASDASGADIAPKLYIVVGADNLSELHKWRDFSEMQKLAEFVVLTRPGYEIPRQWASLKRIEIAVDASSSGFRRDFKGEIPPKIAAEVIKFYKRKDMQDPKQRAERIAEILNEKKAEDVQIIDMEGREYIAKFVVIATTLTARHAASLIEELKSVLKPLGEEFLAIESGDEWSVVDLGDIIVHLISETYRAKYNIEDFLDKLKKEQF